MKKTNIVITVDKRSHDLFTRLAGNFERIDDLLHENKNLVTQALQGAFQVVDIPAKGAKVVFGKTNS